MLRRFEIVNDCASRLASHSSSAWNKILIKIHLHQWFKTSASALAPGAQSFAAVSFNSASTSAGKVLGKPPCAKDMAEFGQVWDGLREHQNKTAAWNPAESGVNFADTTWHTVQFATSFLILGHNWQVVTQYRNCILYLYFCKWGAPHQPPFRLSSKLIGSWKRIKDVRSQDTLQWNQGLSSRHGCNSTAASASLCWQALTANKCPLLRAKESSKSAAHFKNHRTNKPINKRHQTPRTQMIDNEATPWRYRSVWNYPVASLQGIGQAKI